MKKKVVVILTATVLVLSVAFVSVFGIILSSRRKNAFAYYRSAYIDEGVYRYFAYEMQTNIVNFYIENIGVPFDSISEIADFYYEDGRTYGEIFADTVKARVRSVLVCAYLFDSYGYEVDESVIEGRLSTYLTYKTDDGKVSSLNRELEAYGFTYRDLKQVATLLYKEKTIEQQLYGQSGESLEGNANTENECQNFCLQNYKGAKLLFIRTEDRFFVDEDGTVDTESATVALTQEEKLDRQIDIQTFRLNVGGGTATADDMNELITKYANDGNTQNAYYLNADAGYTEELAEGLPSVVEAALALAPGAFTEVAYDGGVCFLLGLSTPADAYLSAENEDCFSDFYALCADYLFTNAVDGLAKDVNFTEKASQFDVFSLPYDAYASNYYVFSIS